MLKLVILVCLTVCSQAFVIGQGQCPDVNSQRNFNRDFMRGEWLESARYFVIYQGLVRCTTWDWENSRDGSVTINFEGVNVLNREVEQEYTFQTSSDSPGVLQFNEGLFRRTTFKVVGTDYNNYAIVYACEQIPFTNTNAQSLWILSRRKTGLDTFSERRVRITLENNGIDPEQLVEVSQDNC